jgi:hypothetical protein
VLEGSIEQVFYTEARKPARKKVIEAGCIAHCDGKYFLLSNTTFLKLIVIMKLGLDYTSLEIMEISAQYHCIYIHLPMLNVPMLMEIM